MKRILFCILLLTGTPLFGISDGAKSYLDKLRNETKHVNWVEISAPNNIQAESSPRNDTQCIEMTSSETIVIELGIPGGGGITVYRPEDRITILPSEFININDKDEFLKFIRIKWYEEATNKLRKSSTSFKKMQEHISKIKEMNDNPPSNDVNIGTNSSK